MTVRASVVGRQFAERTRGFARRWFVYDGNPNCHCSIDRRASTSRYRLSSFQHESNHVQDAEQ
jgi:hypothetical protein